MYRAHLNWKQKPSLNNHIGTLAITAIQELHINRVNYLLVDNI